MTMSTTLELNWNGPRSSSDEAPPLPGLVALLLAGQPACAAIPIPDGETTREITLGREAEFGRVRLNDDWMSRHHARVSVKRIADTLQWIVADLESRNGTHLDGVAIVGKQTASAGNVLRIGQSVFLLCDDVRPYRDQPTCVSDDKVIGPTMSGMFREIERASQFGNSLHIVGESGAGKELAARAFHDFGRRVGGPFIAVNCAAIPEGVAERLLFGARKGAFSGADAHAEGYIQAADGGTLFLDEVAELDLNVQAKLLRTLEMREVLALGAARPVKVDLHICSATHRDLRAEVAAGRLREDLYFRLSRPAVRVPPLRARLEEMPLLIFRTLEAVRRGLKPHPLLVEACLLRAWPGNVRELMAEVRTAGHSAIAENVDVVDAHHLDADAGQRFLDDDVAPVPTKRSSSPAAERIEAVLRAEGGNVSSAARALGLHRTQLRRLLSRHDIDPKTFV